MRTIFATLILTLAVGAPAAATRPIVDTSGDRCHNLSGVQTRIDFGYGAVRYKVKTPRKGDCRYVNHLTIQ